MTTQTGSLRFDSSGNLQAYTGSGSSWVSIGTSMGKSELIGPIVPTDPMEWCERLHIPVAPMKACFDKVAAKLDRLARDISPTLHPPLMRELGQPYQYNPPMIIGTGITYTAPIKTADSIQITCKLDDGDPV